MLVVPEIVVLQVFSGGGTGGGTRDSSGRGGGGGFTGLFEGSITQANAIIIAGGGGGSNTGDVGFGGAGLSGGNRRSCWF